MHRAMLRYSTPIARLIHEAIMPETGREIPKTEVEARFESDELVLKIQAADISALRAALNSYLRWIKLAEEITLMVGEKNG